MSYVYQVMTGTYLPRSKKIFDCRCKAINHIKAILDLADKKLDINEIAACVRLTCIDDQKFPEYRKMFTESELSSPFLKKNDKNNFDDEYSEN